MSELLTHKLSDRPKWWVPRVFMWGAVVLAVCVLVFGLTSFILSTIDSYALNPDAEASDLVFIHFADFAQALACNAMDLLFYAVMFWLLSLAIDKIDQLVWLNASYEDQLEIIAKRQKKKNAK